MLRKGYTVVLKRAFRGKRILSHRALIETDILVVHIYTIHSIVNVVSLAHQCCTRCALRVDRHAKWEKKNFTLKMLKGFLRVYACTSVRARSPMLKSLKHLFIYACASERTRL